MCRPQCTPFSHHAATASFVLAASLVPVLRSADQAPFQLVEGTVLLAALATGLGLRRTNSFEFRFLAVLVSVSVALGTLLALLLGLPGTAAETEISPVLLLLLGLGLAIPAMVALDVRRREALRLATRRPYTL